MPRVPPTRVRDRLQRSSGSAVPTFAHHVTPYGPEPMKWQPPRVVLAASDLSESSDVGLRSAAGFASSMGAELHVVHCAGGPSHPQRGLLEKVGSEQVTQDARQKLLRQVHRVLGEEARVASVEVVTGEAFQAVTSRAEEVDAAVIVLGQHQGRAAFDDLLGTTAEGILRKAAIPCLLTNRPLRPPIRRILIPTDLLVPSQRALERAVDWFVRPESSGGGGGATTIDIVHIKTFASDPHQWSEIQPRLDDMRNLARRRAPEQSRLEVYARIISAPLAEDGIRAAAETLAPDLVVLGTHSDSSLTRVLIGSVASTIVRTLSLPLLLVPTRY